MNGSRVLGLIAQRNWRRAQPARQDLGPDDEMVYRLSEWNGYTDAQREALRARARTTWR